MKLSKAAKRVMSLALATAVTVGSVAVAPAPKKADAASKYTAYLCFATKKWNHRNNHNDSGFSTKVLTEKKKVNAKAKKAKFKNATVKMSKSSKTYTVSLTGLKSGAISKDGGWNSLYVDTNIPAKYKKKFKVSKLTVKVDGKTVKTIKNPVITPDPGASDAYCQVLVINTWNSRCNKRTNATSVKMPKKSISVSFTVKKFK
ncbi:MAG: hypothetical protein SO170_00055 [Butyribacter sp.]|nr:hypothetical protein [bacterium]MDY3853347.1 hypothetical protein [Butyribacter sp.]